MNTLATEAQRTWSFLLPRISLLMLGWLRKQVT